MTKFQRAKARIARDKAVKEQKRLEKYKENDDFCRVITTQHFIEALVKCRKGVSWKGSVQIYTQNAITEISCVSRPAAGSNCCSPCGGLNDSHAT